MGYDGTTQRLSHHQIGTVIPASGNADRFDRSYFYDKIGNVQTITLNSIGDTEQFGYDELNRLVSASDVGHPEWAESDRYDTVDNITAKNIATGTTAYTYTNARHPHAVTSVGTDSYTYDPMGNTLSGGGQQYTWNAQGLPSSITSALAGGGPAPTATPGGPAPNNVNSRVQGSTAPGPVGNTNNRAGGATAAGPVNNTVPVRPGGTGGASSTESYTYDAGGKRLTRTVNGVTTSYFGLYEKDSTGTERWFYSLGGQVVAQRERTGAGGDTRVWLGGDHLGSVSLVTSSTGSILSSTEYSPWRQARGGSGTKPTALDYTGQHRDGTGLVYLGSRYYDPVLGRFLSPDSVVDGVNPYSYLHNNPLNGTDATGHCNDQNDCDKNTGGETCGGCGGVPGNGLPDATGNVGYGPNPGYGDGGGGGGTISENANGGGGTLAAAVAAIAEAVLSVGDLVTGPDGVGGTRTQTFKENRLLPDCLGGGFCITGDGSTSGANGSIAIGDGGSGATIRRGSGSGGSLGDILGKSCVILCTVGGAAACINNSDECKKLLPGPLGNLINYAKADGTVVSGGGPISLPPRVNPDGWVFREVGDGLLQVAVALTPYPNSSRCFINSTEEPMCSFANGIPGC